MSGIRIQGGNAEVVIDCMACREPISAGDGFLYVSYEDIDAYRLGQKTKPALLTPTIMKALPPRAPWKAYHRVCDPDNAGWSTYWVDVSHVSSLSRLLEFTQHIHEKGWLEDTNWVESILGSAERGLAA